MPGARRRPHGLRARSAPVLVAVLIALPVGTAGCASSPAAPTAGAGTTASSGVPAGVTELLDGRAQALLRRDREAWLATVDPADAGFMARQRAFADAATALPVTVWRYRPGGVLSSSADRLELHVLLGYRLQGDTRDVERDQVLTLTRSGTGWRVAAQRAGMPQAADLWDLGPVTVRRGSRAVLVGAASRSGELAGFTADLDAAATAVDAVWGTGWPRTVIALLPADQAGMAQLLGPGHGTGLDRLAAVTTGDVDVQPAPGNGPRPTADRVVLNPAAFAGFGPVARRVVLTHEVTHLATRSAGLGPVPTWLEEGLADYVAYRPSGLARTAVAADLVTAVRAGRAPTALPAAEAFDASHGPVEVAYESAWVAVDLIARQAGPQAPVRFYRAAARDGLETAFRQVLGTDAAGFETRWRAALRALAAEPAG